MKHALTFILSAVIAFASSTAMADTSLWITTEGAGIEVSTSNHHHSPPPRHLHSHGRYCKKCAKKYRKDIRKMEKRHNKEMKKYRKEIKNRHHHRH
ncbi:MAG: hypothetical protein K2N05_12175 [Muribaculaceae bacterium]|nr:hypothetical protein [Muribaculaceae bacterium]